MVNKKVLITGGAGYIGNVLIGHLLDIGHSVTCVDDLRYWQKELARFTENPNFNFIFGDVRNKQLLEETIRGQEFILPLAAIVGMPACNEKPLDAKSINFEAIVLLDGLRTEDQKIIFPTTNSGYGTKSGELHCTEETLLEPISLYGQTKVDAENALVNGGKDFVSLRLATVFGFSPRMRTDLLVNDFVWRAVSDGYLVLYQPHFRRNYIHIRDVARCFEHCIQNFDLMKNQVYNVGLSDTNLSKLELAKRIREHARKLEIICSEIGEDPDKRNYVVSNEKIERTGFKPMFSLDDGVKELIRAYNILVRNSRFANG